MGIIHKFLQLVDLTRLFKKIPNLKLNSDKSNFYYDANAHTVRICNR